MIEYLRALGPEFGGAIGLMFTLANSIAVAMYIIGFAESLLDMLDEYTPDWGGIVPGMEGFRLHDVRIIGTASLVLILVLAIVGMDWVTRVQKLLLVLLLHSSHSQPCRVSSCTTPNFQFFLLLITHTHTLNGCL